MALNLPKKNIHLRLTIKFTPKDPRRLNRFISRLKSLTTGSKAPLYELLQLALVATLWKAYQARFDSHSADYWKPRLATLGKGLSRKRLAQAQSRYKAARATLRALEAAGKHKTKDGKTTERYRNAQEEANKAYLQITGAYVSNTSGGRGQSLREEHATTEKSNTAQTSTYTDRLEQVIHTLISEARRSNTPNSYTLSFGKYDPMGKGRAGLDKLPTTDLPTESKFNIRWRQLEFGTGIYAKKALNLPPSQSIFKLQASAIQDGSWLWGGVRVFGHKPGNIFRKASGLPYTEDARQFGAVVCERLTQYLLG